MNDTEIASLIEQIGKSGEDNDWVIIEKIGQILKNEKSLPVSRIYTILSDIKRADMIYVLLHEIYFNDEKDLTRSVIKEFEDKIGWTIARLDELLKKFEQWLTREGFSIRKVTMIDKQRQRKIDKEDKQTKLSDTLTNWLFRSFDVYVEDSLKNSFQSFLDENNLLSEKPTEDENYFSVEIGLVIIATLQLMFSRKWLIKYKISK